jgi:hypothetical protein
MLLEETRLKWSDIGYKSPLGAYGLVVSLGFLRPSCVSKAHFLASIRTKYEMSQTADSPTDALSTSQPLKRKNQGTSLLSSSLLMSYKRI